MRRNGELWDFDRIEWFKMKSEDVEWCGWTEKEEEVTCDICGGRIMFNPAMNNYYCDDCEQTMSRKEFFNYIGAEPPYPECASEECEENYPLCREWCRFHS